MKKILVPIDFSEDAENALHFAAAIGKKFNAAITLYHSYVLPVYASDLPLGMPSDAELEKSSMDGLTYAINRFSKLYPEIKFDLSVNEGYAEDQISKTAKNVGADLIVMGTKGASGLREVLVGTITASVLDTAHCPVLAIPYGAKWKQFSRLVYATNYEEGDFQNVQSFIEFAKMFNAEVVILHISDNNEQRVYEVDAIERFKERLVEETKYGYIKFQVLGKMDIYEGLNAFIEQSGADLLAMTIRHRSFTQKLFERSMSKRMAYHSHLPLMIYHS
ncbi:MAG: hypothetical protein RIQ47_600 [Bacteroidota bacterium]|jgi:nucleotide-binding universal stress UspA family protein